MRSSPSLLREQVQLAVGTFTERRRFVRGRAEADLHVLPVVLAQRAQTTVAVVGEHVQTLELGDLGAAVDIAADHRAVTVVVRQHCDGLDGVLDPPGPVRHVTLEDVPSEVVAARLVAGDPVDLLDRAA